MKRYLIFTGSTYYPTGGWFDFIGSEDSVEKAKDFLLSASDHIGTGPRAKDWSHIVDSETGKIVWPENAT